jgi:hypothetical protein
MYQWFSSRIAGCADQQDAEADAGDPQPSDWRYGLAQDNAGGDDDPNELRGCKDLCKV